MTVSTIWLLFNQTGSVKGFAEFHFANLPTGPADKPHLRNWLTHCDLEWYDVDQPDDPIREGKHFIDWLEINLDGVPKCRLYNYVPYMKTELNSKGKLTTRMKRIQRGHMLEFCLRTFSSDPSSSVPSCVCETCLVSVWSCCVFHSY